MSSFQEAVDAIKATPEQEQAETPEVEAQVQTDEIEIQEDVDLEVVDKVEIPTVDMPTSWSKSNTDEWDELTPAAQERYAERERNLQSDYSRRQTELSSKEKALSDSIEESAKLKADYLERLKSGSREPSIDLLDPNSEKYDPDTYHLAKAKQTEGLAEIKKLDDEITLEDVEKRRVWQENEIKVYQDVLPEFVDTEKGPAFRQKLAEYAVKVQGITMEQAKQGFPVTPAKEMNILFKAMKYDEAVARQRAAKKTPKPKSLSGGNSNPQPVKKVNVKSAVAKFVADRSPAAAAELLGLK